MYKLLLIFLIFLSFQSIGQVSIEPTISPDFFAADEEITITYDVTGTSMHDWTEAWLWLWLPDQNNVDVASNVNPASSNTSATNPAKFTKSEVNAKQLFTLTLTLTDFTGVSKENIKQVGMLIKGNDWSDGQSSDYVTTISEGFTLVMENPAGNYAFHNSNQTINIIAKTSEAATIEIYIDDVLSQSISSATLLETTHDVIIDGLVHVIKSKATNGAETQEKTYSYTSTPTTIEQSLPLGLKGGINYKSDDTQATLVLLAPGKDYIFVLGDFNNWKLDNDYLMLRDGERFWLDISNLTSGKEYVFQYLIDGEILVADPYTDKVSDPWDDQHIDQDTYPDLIKYPTGNTEYRAAVLQTGQQPYQWTNTNFVAPAKEHLTIYELLVRDFDEKHSYQAVIDTLDYLQKLGINAIELMPINEFEGNQSWGYNPNFYFAPDKYYGTKNDLKELIDECHNRGIAVIIDLVLNHSFNSSPLARMYWDESTNRPAADNPWYNEIHNFENPAAHWGTDFDHESSYTQDFIDSVNNYWVSEYKVDGFRFDFTKGFGNKFKRNSSDSWGSRYDASRIALLKRMADQIWQQNPDTYVIFEHLAENSEEQELANYGIMLWGNMNHNFRTVAKGGAASLSTLYHTFRGWNAPNAVGYMESHDEERVGWDVLKTFGLRESMQRLKLNAAFFFPVPGPKMIWQFEELGYDEELNNDRLAIKPTHWEYLAIEDRKQLFDVYLSLINLRSKTDYINAEYFTWSASTPSKWINITHPDVTITIIGNFGKSSEATKGRFTKNGTWFDYFSGEIVEVTDFENQKIILSPGEFKIYTSSVIENYVANNPAEYVTGIPEGQKSEFAIHPNPAESHLCINKEFKTARVLDLQGKPMAQVIVVDSTIQIDQLSAGIYLIEITGANDSKHVIRFIKN